MREFRVAASGNKNDESPPKRPVYAPISVVDGFTY